MNTSKPTRTNSPEDHKSHVAEAAQELLNEGKKLASEIYETNARKVSEAQNQIHEHVKEYSDELSNKVKTNPLTSLLIAGGIGFLISALLRK